MTLHFSEDERDDVGAAVAQFRRALDRRVDAHLRAHPHAGVPRVARAAAPRFSARPWALGVAVVLVIVATGAAIVWPRGAQRYTTGEGGTQFTLADGSRVEMRARSALTVDRTADGLRIQLTQGGIIVNAAKQRSGHLYVQTKDMTVSVVGTVFLVNTEEDGSRVAVIEGEVRVREGTIETRLRPGEQVATNPAVATRPVKEEIAWSREADTYLGILETFARGMAMSAGPRTALTNAPGSVNAFDQGGAAAGPAQSTAQGKPAARPQFEEASVRPCDPDNIPAPPAGSRGGGANSFQMSPGRTHALCLTLATIVRHAYGYGPVGLEFLNPGGRGRGFVLNAIYGLGMEDGRRVRGGPDWVRSEHYTIDAVANDAADAATMSGPMLRDLLERRFQLKLHIETEQIPAFALTLARGGLKIKPAEPGACVSVPPVAPGVPILNGVPAGVRRPSVADVRRGEKRLCGLWPQRNGPNNVVVGGEATLADLARVLGSPLGGVQVFDKTGSTDKFNFILEYVVDENTPGPGLVTGPPAPEPSDIPRGQTIFAALEEQLGLRLEPARAPREFIVIDQVERPAPN